ncbi:MAG: ABC transporter ATP-binding protein [Desulfobacteraceae bacterium]|nr:ABC transporter ATP-binding protein [Desulfobacteraceae bacterium]
MAVSLECRDLRFTYQDNPVLNHITFKVHSGRFCAILGRNGSGKTTLLHCLNNILSPDAGKVLVHGRDILTMDQKQIAQQISLVPQEHLDIFPYRVIDVVVMGRAPFLGMSQRPGKPDYKMAKDALNFLNAGTLALKNFNRISGGERQMTLLARALAQTTCVMLLDEPTNHLDFNNQYHLLAAMKSLCRTKNISIVASMHDPNMAALFADDLILIKEGCIMAKGSVNEVMTQKNISNLYDTQLGQVKINNHKKLFFPETVLTGTMDTMELEKERKKEKQSGS